MENTGDELLSVGQPMKLRVVTVENSIATIRVILSVLHGVRRRSNECDINEHNKIAYRIAQNFDRGKF